MDTTTLTAAGVLALLLLRRREPTPDDPYRYVPRLDAALIPDEHKPIALNEYGLPERIFLDAALFPLRFGDLGDLVRDYQVAVNWKGGDGGTIVLEDGWFGRDMQAWVARRTGAGDIDLQEFVNTVSAFPSLAEVYATAAPAIGAMQSFRRVHAYAEPGKTGLSWTRGRSGVYVIYEDRRRVYIGHSTTDLYRTITRHFQAWDDPTQRRVSYADRLHRHRYDVAVTFTTPKQAESLERTLIIKHQPRDNDEKYAAYTADSYDQATAERYGAVAADPLPVDDPYGDLPF